MRLFLEDTAVQVPIPGTSKTVLYRKEKKTGILTSMLGTSEAVSIGAYAYALAQLDR